MKTYEKVSRKTVGEDRIAICPKFGCENVTRVKHLKLGFLGFSKYPKCKKHQIPLVYIDERIGDFVDAALACLFDLAGLPPKKLLSLVNKEIPEDLEMFVSTWVYCITIGRGAPIISQYMDSISNTYLKQLTKKQIKAFSQEDQSKKNNVYQAIRKGIQEITNQYTRLLKHLRTHNEVFTNIYETKPLSGKLRKLLLIWLEMSKLVEKDLLSIEEKREISLSETKNFYDSILNMGTCMCLLGLSPEKRMNKTKRISAFDRFSTYFDFFTNGLTKKFTKSDMEKLLKHDFSETSLKQNMQDRDLISFFPQGRKLSATIPGLKVITLGRSKNTNKRECKYIEFIDDNFYNTLTPPSDPSLSNVNEWFTDTLLETMKQYDFLKKYASFRSMSLFFGLTKSYLYDKRYKKSVISHDYLDIMRNSVVENISNLLDLDNTSEERVIEARNRLVTIIEIYRKSFSPKLTANTQIDNNLITTYFQNISTPQQAYYLGLLFADGWISIQRSSGGSTSYRIGLSLKVEDKLVIERFSKAIGLSKSRVLERDSIDLRTGAVYRMAYLQLGVGSTSQKTSMANDLIKMGLTYQIKKNGRRAKVPILPVFCDVGGHLLRDLMLAFLLGYFDGDGTLKNSHTGEIYSNNFKFLTAIKKVFNLGEVSDVKRIVYDPTTNTHSERHLYSLYLNKSIIKEMMSLDIVSMERKSLEAELIKLDAPIMTKQRLWLKKVLPIKFLGQILTTHSPSKIAELLGVDHNTMLKFMKNVYKLNLMDKGYYIKLSYERKQSSVKNKLNKIYNERTQLLLEIGERNPFNQ